jgi:iron complex outermembrane receptor protein
MKRFVRLGAVCLFALGLALPAAAQKPADQSDPAAQPKRDVVVVTANKREESVQDIAVAVTAIGSETRDELGIQSMADLTNFTPGLSYSTASDRIALRGIGRNTNNFGTEPGVANYLDGLYTSFATLGAREPIFLDRTEVVRGPQGTLYGRNSIGGALNLISKRPTSSPYAEVRIGIGDYDTEKYQAAASGPINDSLRWRIAAAKTFTGDGYFKNVAGGPTEGGRINQDFVEAQLAGNIGDNFEWWLKADHTYYNNYGAPGGRTDVGSTNAYNTGFGGIGTSDLYPRNGYAYAGGIAHTQLGNVETNPAATDLFRFNTDTPIHDIVQGGIQSYEAVYHAPGFDIKALGGYTYYHYRLILDNDSTPIKSFTCGAIDPVDQANGAACDPGTVLNPSARGGYDEKRGFFSNEVNFISTYDSPLQWIAGLYAYQENYGQPSYASLPEQAGITSATDGVNLVLNDFNFDENTFTHPYAPNPNRYYFYDNNNGIGNSYGAFGQIDWSFAKSFKATLGLRYSEDIKHLTETGRLQCFRTCYIPGMADITRAVWTGKLFAADGVTEIAPDGVVSSTPGNLSGVTYDEATGLASREMRDKWTAVTGTAGLEWRPDDDTLTYVKYSRGYKAGGFGAATTYSAFAPRVEVDKEIADAYELGLKREWRALHLVTNLDIFYYDYKNAQTPLNVVPPNGLPYTALVNIPKTGTTGIELETTWSPIDNLNIVFNYAYLNAEIKEACCFLDSNDPFAILPGANRALPVPGTSGPTTQYAQSLKGNVQPNAPTNKVALNIGYTFELGTLGSLTASGSYFWRDSFYSDVFNRLYNKTPAYDQVDLRVLWNSSDRKYTMIGYVRNAANKKGYESLGGSLRQGTNSPTSIGTFDIVPTLNAPRTIGAEFQVRF